MLGTRAKPVLPDLEHALPPHPLGMTPRLRAEGAGLCCHEEGWPLSGLLSSLASALKIVVFLQLSLSA